MVAVSQTLLVLGELTSMGSTCQVLWEFNFNLGLSGVSLVVTHGLWGFGKVPHFIPSHQ